MDTIKEVFIETLKCYFSEDANCSKHLEQKLLAFDGEELKQLLILSQKQNLLAVITEALVKTDIINKMDKGLALMFKQLSVQQTIEQISRTNMFIRTVNMLAKENLYPILVKGLSCRLTYPQPDSRPSNDEDIFINSCEIDKYHKALINAGFETDNTPSEQLLLLKGELAYLHKNSGLYIDLHKNEIEGAKKLAEEVNEYFENAFNNPIQLEFASANIKTLNHTAHLLYLVIHAKKHFLVNGFGIRQVTDIILFTKVHKDDIDFKQYVHMLKISGAYKFAAAIYSMADMLGLQDEQYNLQKEIDIEYVDATDMIEDILSGGVFGSDELAKRQSATMMLNAAEGKDDSLIVRSLFPGREYMTNIYPDLAGKPHKLAYYYVKRIAGYLFKKSDKNSKISVDNAKKRIELMKEYEVIE